MSPIPQRSVVWRLRALHFLVFALTLVASMVALAPAASAAAGDTATDRQQAQDPRCDGITPATQRGRLTLRLINFFPDGSTVSSPEYPAFPMMYGDIKDIDVAQGSIFTVRPVGYLPENMVNYTRSHVGNGTTYCWVMGIEGGVPTATPTPARMRMLPAPTNTPGQRLLPAPTNTPGQRLLPAPTATFAAGQRILPAPTATFAAGQRILPGATPAPGARIGLAVPGTTIALYSYNYPERFVRHSSYNGRVDPIASDSDKLDATFKVVAGLGDAGQTSLESVNFPGFFLINENGYLVLRERTADAAFATNATFIQRAGLADPNMISFESVGLPGHFIRHSGFQLFIQPPDGTEIFNQDATFGQADPVWPSAPAAGTPAPAAPTVAPVEPTVAPVEPTVAPVAPTVAPVAPTVAPVAPTVAPVAPTVAPVAPTVAPTAAAPAAAPTAAPTPSPTPVLAACTQEAFRKAVADGEASGTITLDGACRYELTSAAESWAGGSGVVIRKATVIEGNGAVIERAATAPQFRILMLDAPAGTVVRNLTIRNGSVNDNGAGIHTNRDLTLERVTLEGNTATNMGGAVTSWAGKLIIHNSRLLGNSAAQGGGAIFKQAGVLEVANTLFAQNKAANNAGAAIYLGGGADPASRVTNSTITHTPRQTGAAITLWSGLTLRNTLIANYDIGVQSGDAKSGLDEDYNLYANTATDVQALNGTQPKRGGNSVRAPDARFVDAAALNFALQATSPAADRGTDAVLSGSTVLATDAAGLARPFTGTKVDIGAYELQEPPALSLAISLQGPLWITTTEVATYTFAVANPGTISGDQVSVVNVLPTGATYVADSATGGGVFADGRVTWQLGTLAPGANLLLTYAVTPTQTLVHNNYSVQSASEPRALTSGAVITTPLNTKLVAYTGFLPNPDGFSFSNYSDSPVTDLPPEALVFIFGEDVVCKSKNPCVLTATAEAWRDERLKFLAGGHCAGMAMGSLNIWANASVAPSDLQSKAKLTFELTKPNARGFVAVYASTQTMRPADSTALDAAGLDRSPAQVLQGTTWIQDPILVLDTLIANLKDPNAKDFYRLSVRGYPPRPGVDGGKGHTVVPFAVERVGNTTDEYLIYVYENNNPNQTDRAIKINRTTGVWSYIGTTNPSVPLLTWHGDKTSSNLSLTSWQFAHTFPKECGEVCPPKPAATAATPAAPAPGRVSVHVSGEASPLVTRSDGARVGFDPITGEWINEIEGAAAVETDLGLGLNIPPAIELPHEAGMTYDVQVASRETTFGNTEAPVNVDIAGPGFAASVDDLVLNLPPRQAPTVPTAEEAAAGEEAVEPPAEETALPAPDLTNLNVDIDQKRLVIDPGTDDAEAPTLVLAVSQPDGSDFRVAIAAGDVAAGTAVALGFDANTQSVTLESNAEGEKAYQVEVKRTNLDGTQNIYTAEALGDAGNPGLTIDVGPNWNGDDAPAIQFQENPTLPPPAEVPAPGADVAEPAAPAAPAAPQVATCDTADLPDPINTDVLVRFVNDTDVVVGVYWVDPDGNYQQYHQLEPGAFADQETFAEHQWLAIAADDLVLLDYTATADIKQCVRIQLP